MLIKKPDDIKSSEITDKTLFLTRRRFLTQAAVAGAAIAGLAPDILLPAPARAGEKLAGVQKSRYTVNEPITPLKDIKTYNNFYEFGTDKYSPAQYAKTLQ